MIRIAFLILIINLAMTNSIFADSLLLSAKIKSGFFGAIVSGNNIPAGAIQDDSGNYLQDDAGHYLVAG